MDIVETIGGEILEALKEDAGGWEYVGKEEELSATVLDGHFDLTKVARAAIRATLRYYMENVSEGMEREAARVLRESYGEYRYLSGEGAIEAALSEALKELDA